MNHALAPLLKRFFAQYLPVQRGLSPQTILAYRDALKLLLGYAADTLATTVDALCVEALTQTLVVGFLDHLQQVRGCRERTRNARLAAIRTFFAFVAREEPSLAQQCQQVRSIPLKRAPCKPVTYLEETQMQRILEAIDPEARTGVRDQALLLLLYNTGARVSEIVGLHFGELHLDASPYVELLGKGRKARTCPLWPETAEALQAYLRQRVPAQPDITEVFLNANGAAITRFGIRYVTRKYGAKALPASANAAVNPHTVRHYSESRTIPSRTVLESLFLFISQGWTVHSSLLLGIIWTPTSYRSLVRGTKHQRVIYFSSTTGVDFNPSKYHLLCRVKCLQHYGI